MILRQINVNFTFLVNGIVKTEVDMVQMMAYIVAKMKIDLIFSLELLIQTTGGVLPGVEGPQSWEIMIFLGIGKT